MEPTLYINVANAGALALCQQNAAASRFLLQAPWEAPPDVLTVDTSNRTVYVNSTLVVPLTNTIPGFQAVAVANYPDPATNPDAWKYKTISNATVVVGTSLPVFITRIDSISNSKLAPAVALSGANVQAPGPVAILARSAARSRPGQQYGATIGVQDFVATSTGEHNPTVSSLDSNSVAFLLNQDVETGQGQAINLVKAQGESKNLVVADIRATTYADRWYMAPGNAIAGSAFNLRGGQTSAYSRHRTKASIGSAMSGVLHNLIGTGDINRGNLKGNLQREAEFLIDHGAIARAENRANTDVGPAQSGNIQLAKSYRGDTTLVGLAQARTAVGNAAAGAVNVAYAEDGDVYIGDYWDELSNPGNAVLGTNFGRGTAQGGQVNIAVAPNADVRTGGTVAATAVQGGSTAGAFSLGNGAGDVEIEEDVAAVTAEYTAASGNVGVAVTGQRGSVVTTTVSRSDTGSALSYDISAAVVGQQNSAVGSATSTTNTGQAAALGAGVAVSGVQADTQGASVARTATGNALSTGSAFSGSAFQGRSVATSTAASTDGASLSTGWSGTISADSDASAAASAATTTGNAAATGQSYGLGVLQVGMTGRVCA